MSESPSSGDSQGLVERMGIKPSMIVMEFGYDGDVDAGFREQVEEITGEQLVDENSDEVADLVLLWFRDGDGDLVDAMVDAIAPLAENGFIWLLTPRRGRDGYVEPSDINEGASVAGLSQTSLASVGSDWSGARLVGRKTTGGRR